MSEGEAVAYTVPLPPGWSRERKTSGAVVFSDETGTPRLRVAPSGDSEIPNPWGGPAETEPPYGPWPDGTSEGRAADLQRAIGEKLEERRAWRRKRGIPDPLDLEYVPPPTRSQDVIGPAGRTKSILTYEDRKAQANALAARTMPGPGVFSTLAVAASQLWGDDPVTAGRRMDFAKQMDDAFGALDGAFGTCSTCSSGGASTAEQRAAMEEVVASAPPPEREPLPPPRPTQPPPTAREAPQSKTMMGDPRNTKTPVFQRTSPSTGVISYARDVSLAKAPTPSDGTVVVYVHGERGTGDISPVTTEQIASDVRALFPDATHVHASICYGSSKSGSLAEALRGSSVETLTVGEGPFSFYNDGSGAGWESGEVRHIFVDDGSVMRGPPLGRMK